MASGIFGFMGYDMVRLMEDIGPDSSPDEIDIPDSVFIRPSVILVFDSVEEDLKVVKRCIGVAGDTIEQLTARVKELEADQASQRVQMEFRLRGIELQEATKKEIALLEIQQNEGLTVLKADLAAIDRSVTPWVFVNTHAPLYNTNTAHQGDGEAMRVALEPLWYAAGVDVVYTGHVHAYERNHRAYNNQRDPKGPVYITIGDGGK